MIKKGNPKPLCPKQKTWWCWDRGFAGRNYRVNLLLILPVTAGIGVLSGMLGITGGVIKLPLMVLFCGVPMDIAIATSTVMVAVTALFGLGGHVMAGHFNFYIRLFHYQEEHIHHLGHHTFELQMKSAFYRLIYILFFDINRLRHRL